MSRITSQSRFAVLGAGAWGTALGQMLASEGRPVTIWAYEQEVADAINEAHENSVYLPGKPLSEMLTATTDLADLDACDALLVVSPAQHMRGLLEAFDAGTRTLILCSKGMEAKTHMLMAEVAAEVQPAASLAVLTGPTFAHEVAGGLPSAVTLAADTLGQADNLAEAIAKPWFRPYSSDDIIGAEIGGAVKNVLAIACGIVDGARLGQNARAALISRGFAEMTRFGVAKGARRETLAGLAGLGDLVLTCSSPDSRNFSLGRGLGEGRSAADLLGDRRTVAEGAHSAPVIQAAARELGVEVPIVDAVCAVLGGEADVGEVVHDLLARPLKPEDM